ncbi:hypothetical protein LEP1GSC133_2882 [Leptospira borgpetersenii serovar Pomona str. 200901868]|uniref:Uncharacterized protein n=1 Tax=Leptospira borgpetersenii serovar Pomona str. 200901868 TaxID=1192866 RepID=M6WKK8_LEPBO|nr:hypothetical protein LEP1GSC133_2882 [Leptospira borgpetersenii serovar Pomona str. 200901868]
MKVKCIKLKTEKTYQIEHVPHWMEGFMNVGEIYTVFGLDFDLDMISVYIFFDERHVVMAPIEIFRNRR